MTVIDLHREDLIDKLRAGTLSEGERAQLDSHVTRCAACRFELRVVDDFASELAAGEAPIELGRAVTHALGGIERSAAAPRGRARALVVGGVLLAAAAAAAAWSLQGPDAAPQPPPASAPAMPMTVSAPARVERAQPSVAPIVRESASAESAASARPPAAVQTAAELFAAANQARRRGEPERAIALYRELQRRYPESREAELSHATLGRLLLDRHDEAAALGQFEQYLGDAGQTALEEEALVGRAMALGRLGRASEERAAWQELLARFPDSIHAARARARLNELAP